MSPVCRDVNINILCRCSYADGRMSVCLYECTYVRAYVCMSVRASVRSYMRTHVLCVRMHVCVCACMCVHVRACATRYDQKHDIEQVFGSLDVPSGFELFFEIAGTCLNWEVAQGHTECNCRNT